MEALRCRSRCRDGGKGAQRVRCFGAELVLRFSRGEVIVQQVQRCRQGSDMEVLRLRCLGGAEVVKSSADEQVRGAEV